MSTAVSAGPDWRLKSVYPWFLPVQTRWLDNDQYGHVNNAVYHALFDSVINIYLIRWAHPAFLAPTKPPAVAR